MSVLYSLPDTHDELLKEAAKVLGISEQEALNRAVARLHCALFSTHDEPNLDMSQSLDSLSGPREVVSELPGLSRK